MRNPDFKEFSDEEMRTILKQMLPDIMFEQIEFLAKHYPLGLEEMSVQMFVTQVFHAEIAKWGRSLTTNTNALSTVTKSPDFMFGP